MKKPKLERIDNHVESLLLTGMIVSTKFLEAVRDIYHSDLIEVPFVRTVAKWCLEYHAKYHRAPRTHIQDIFQSHRRNGLDPDQADLIGEYLESISEEHERAKKFNVEYLLGQVEARFKDQSLRNLADDIKTLLAEGRTQEAEFLQASYKQIERPVSTGVEPLTDRGAIYDAFEARQEDVLFQAPGDLGRFLGPFERQSFIAVMGPEKRGKTWTLLQFAVWALQARCNVAFFECGDMSERDMVRRFLCNIARASDRHEGRILVPTLDCQYNQDNSCQDARRACDFGVLRGEEKVPFAEAKGYRPCTRCRKDDPQRFQGAVWHRWEDVARLDWRGAVEAGRKFGARFGNKRLMLSTHSTRSINVRRISQQLDLWERAKQFVPDVVLVDYADILAPEDSKSHEPRQQEFERWAAMRALSQDRHVALFTATQADADSYTRGTLGELNFSEDKRKYGHATMFITLNQLAQEKAEGVMRFGTMFVRESRFDVRRTCTVLQCLDLGRPYLASFLRRYEKK